MSCLMRMTMMATIVLVTMISLTTLTVSIPVYRPYQLPNNESTLLYMPSGPGNRCLVLDKPGPCRYTSSWRQGVTLPNVYGHLTVDQAFKELETVLKSLPSAGSSNELVKQFLCTLYLPPCLKTGHGSVAVAPEGGGSAPSLSLPCRPLCEMARGEVEATGQPGVTSTWPSNIRCHVFPTERCYALAGPSEVKYVINALVASGTAARMLDVIPQSVAPLESELGDDDPFDVQVVTLGANHIPPRRYDLSDLGDPAYFQGWADVQGTGAANDYCRVIGKGKRRFLSCALAGTRGNDHQYVSKLGFEAGHPGTWFMRDVDSDGRDDYCRCIGEEAQSRVVCMKAGEKGFYGSTVEGGSENTFELPKTRGCHHKHLNPHFGL